MIPSALFKKILRVQFIASVEVSNIARCSSKTNELRDKIDLEYSSLESSQSLPIICL